MALEGLPVLRAPPGRAMKGSVKKGLGVNTLVNCSFCSRFECPAGKEDSPDLRAQFYFLGRSPCQANTDWYSAGP